MFSFFTSVKSKITFVLLLLASFLTSEAQTAKEFWFAAPDALTGYESPIYLRVTTLGKSATVSVTEPSNGSFVTVSQTIAANSNYTFNLSASIAQVENTGANVVSNKGLKIVSTENILAYYEIAKGDNNEIFALKGTNALGTSFIVPSMKRFSSGGYGARKNSFYVVASQNSTVLTITPVVDLTGHTVAAGAFTINLNAGQVYIAEAASTTVHVGGTRVSADKPVAITYASDLTGAGGCNDLDGDQIVPSSLAGDAFITMPGYLASVGGSDFIYIYPTQNATAITVNGVLTATKNIGEFLEIASANITYYITTNKPVLVYQLSGFGCELGGGVIPSIECTGSQQVGITRSTIENLYFNILVKTGGESSFTLNGSTSEIVASDFINVPNTGGAWKYSRKLISTTTLAAGAGAIIKNSTKPFHLGIIQGGSGGGKYGYFSNFSAFAPDIEATNYSQVCEGSGTTSTLSTPLTGSFYQWKKDGVGISGATGSTYVATVPGSYTVDITYDALCPLVTSSVSIVTSGCLVPLKLLSFKVHAAENKNILTWVTENELNTSHFVIEISSDARNFSEAGNVVAKNQAGRNTYSFDDLFPVDNTVYYRLKQVDQNGSFTYSDIQQINSGRHLQLLIAPNPVIDRITFSSPISRGLISIRIYNSAGGLLESKTITAESKITVAAGHLSPGVYMLELSAGDIIQRARFLKN